MAANRPEAVLDLKLTAPGSVHELNTVTTIITPSTISKITTSTSSAGSSDHDEGNRPLAKATINNSPVGSGGGGGGGGGGGEKTQAVNSDNNNNNSDGVGVRKSTCSQCTNISIMQLFYAMKQSFPTVPDNVVTECVMDNCHNRAACLDQLKAHLAKNLIGSSAYPAKSVRQQQQKQQQQVAMFNELNSGGEARPGSGMAVAAANGRTMSISSSSDAECDMNCNRNNINNNNNGNTSNVNNNVGNSIDRNKTTALRTGENNWMRSRQQQPPTAIIRTGGGVPRGMRFQSPKEGESGSAAVPQGRTPLTPNNSRPNHNNNNSSVTADVERTTPATSDNNAAAASAAAFSKVERPTTLNLQANRPLRIAPPIPSSSSTSSLSSLSGGGSSSNLNDQLLLLSAVTPTESSASSSINLSVNVTLSPVMLQRSKPPIPPPRHTSALTVQPEPALMLPAIITTPTTAGPNSSAAAAAGPPRSFTSVNFTLRQPTTTITTTSPGAKTPTTANNNGDTTDQQQPPPQPIDISTAGSSLTYSSSSYDAKQGYQSRLQITVGNGGGSISAIRTRSPNFQPPTTPIMTTAAIRGQQQQQQGGPAAARLAGLVGGPSSSSSRDTRLDADAEEILVSRQLQSKRKLTTELDKYKKRLESMQREIWALNAPLPVGGPERLQDEIERLRTTCKQMAMAVEEAGEFVLGETNEAFYQNIYTGQLLPSQLRPQKPPRPPPPPAHIYRNLLAANQQRPHHGQHQQHDPLSPLSVPSDPVAPHYSTGMNVDNSPATSFNNINNNNNQEGPPWTCNLCTFQNHPLLNKCEQCDNLRMIGHSQPQQQRQQPYHHQQQQQQTGIVQITNSQFIPARMPTTNAVTASPCPINASSNSTMMMSDGNHNAINPNRFVPQTPATTSITTAVAGNPLPMLMLNHQHAYLGPQHLAVHASVASPSPVTTLPKSPKVKRGSALNKKISQSISNLFSLHKDNSSSSSSSNTNNASASANEAPQ